MRILVTGATGFVGRHLLSLLVSRRNEVFGTFLEPVSDGVPPHAELVRCDLRDARAVSRLVQEVRPQHVYHLAALSSVRDSFEDVNAVYQANFFGTLNLLDALRSAQPAARILLVGSGHCYGKVRRAELPIGETRILAPISPYAVSKAAADLLGGQFFQNYGVSVIRVRPFNHTGPGQSTHFVCSDFARQLAAIELGLAPPVIRVGNLNSKRDFSDVRDVVLAYLLLLQKGRAGEIYNVGSGHSIALRDVLTILCSFCTRKVSIEVEQERLRRGEEDVLYCSNRKLKKATGWRPQYGLKTTLRDLYRDWIARLATPPVSSAIAGRLR